MPCPGLCDQLIGSDPANPISEVWLWQAPASTLQFVTNPQNPTTGNSQWANWARSGSGISGSLVALQANAAYLIRSVATTNYTWRIVGKPVAPSYTWSSSGLNFLGFPTSPDSPPAFDAFLALGSAFADAQQRQIYQYQGGNLGPANPSALFALHTTPVMRGQAFWMRTGSAFNNYFGPFQVGLSTGGGLAFGDLASQLSFRLRNVTPTNISVTFQLVASEPTPSGQAPIAGLPPLLVRGSLNTSNITYGFTALTPGARQTWSLKPQGQPGSDIVILLGLNRYAMTGDPGDLFAGILEFTDSFGFTEVDVPVSAVMSSLTGLWVGNAKLDQVANYLKIYETNNPVLSTNGSYIVTGIITNLGPVARSYPLRLIVHNSGTQAVLLQRVYFGLDPGSDPVLATSEGRLDPSQLGTARRISCTHLPWSAANSPWPFTGRMSQGATLSTTATLSYSDQSCNPFLHTYHPDLDNLDATFQAELPQGAESYQVTRQISLSILPPGNDFISLTSASQTLSGNYSETITLAGLRGVTRAYNVTGAFALNRISTIPTLSQ